MLTAVAATAQWHIQTLRAAANTLMRTWHMHQQQGKVK